MRTSTLPVPTLKPEFRCPTKNEVAQLPALLNYTQRNSFNAELSALSLLELSAKANSSARIGVKES